MLERRKTVLDSIRDSALSIAPVPLGYSYHFNSTSEVLARLVGLIDLERQCCPFLTFKIIIEAGHQSICLEITGPPEAKGLIADFFGA